jgi:hypothetical protein
MKKFVQQFARLLSIAPALCLGAWVVPVLAQQVIVGIDTKVFWDADGKTLFSAPGKDAVVVMDISDRVNPRLVASLPLMNSVFGPPVNWPSRPTRAWPWWPTRWTGSRTAARGKAFLETTFS